jgi:hypothetical protein
VVEAAWSNRGWVPPQPRGRAWTIPSCAFLLGAHGSCLEYLKPASGRPYRSLSFLPFHSLSLKKSESPKSFRCRSCLTNYLPSNYLPSSVETSSLSRTSTPVLFFPSLTPEFVSTARPHQGHRPHTWSSAVTMRTSTLATLALGAGAASAASLKRQSSLPSISVKGNGL